MLHILQCLAASPAHARACGQSFLYQINLVYTGTCLIKTYNRTYIAQIIYKKTCLYQDSNPLPSALEVGSLSTMPQMRQKGSCHWIECLNSNTNVAHIEVSCSFPCARLGLWTVIFISNQLSIHWHLFNINI